MLGYTAGVYDLFHVGHLRLLERAAAGCDHLTVGVTTDELSFSAKGKYPIVPFEERSALVAAVRFVDAVVPQHDIDKFVAWQELGFDRIFVGSDWQGTPRWVALEERFASVGVEVVYLPYTESTSSTALRLQIESLLSSAPDPAS